ncbi:MAG: tetratricopeptide repeat protein [Pyrinomonadaceae bacterium]
MLERLLPLLRAAAALCAAACAAPASAQVRRGDTPAPQSGGSRAVRASGHDESRAAALVADGAHALARGDEGAARDSFAKALQADPDNVDAHTYLGVLADRAGDLTDAERHFAAAVAFAPYSASARNNYGAVLVRLGRTQLAAAQFEASLKLDAAQPSALVNLAQLRSASGKPEDLRAARELFAHAMKVAPDAEIARALVVIALRLGEMDSAAAAYRDYAARVAEASTPAAASSSSAPASAAARAELGQALLEGGLVEEAIGELNAASVADPADANALVALARAYLRHKEIPAAGRVLEGAVARGLDAAPVYAALAEVYEAAGRVENAIPAMRLALARDPKNETYRFRYGLLLTDASAPAASVIRLREALKEFPASARIWLALGIAQLTDGKNADAEESFRRSLELDPKSVPALGYLGTTYAERGDYEQALACYERAIAADANQAVVYYLAADTILKLPGGDSAKAEQYLKRAISLEPTLAAARLALAKIYERAERWSDAAPQLERAVGLAPDLNEAHYHLGRVYQRLGRSEDARREMALFKEQSDTEKQRREAERRDLVRRLADVRF